MPEISVLLPVYNCARFLDEALESVLGQTWRDFECIVIDDGSTDGSQEIVRRRRDPRIHLVQNPENLGVARTLNRGMEIARGRYVARMDADDVSRRDRFFVQRRFLERNPSAGICGAWVRARREKGRAHVLRFPADPGTVQAYTLFNNPLAHPVVMWRADALKKYALRYDESLVAGQDYALWSRCVRAFPVHNIPRVLLDWHLHDEGVTHRCFDRSNAAAMAVQRRELEALGLRPSEEELLLHRRTGSSCGVNTVEELRRAAGWLVRLVAQNGKVHRYERRGMLRAASLVWFRLCANSSHLGPSSVRAYLNTPLLRHYRPSPRELLFFVLGACAHLRRRPAGELLGGRPGRAPGKK